ncbi:MAG TPA: FHA domain-containing protein [Pirellulales bacterium]|nr:FHA domain-containing protein [Pirellulales bacterium]
MEAKLIVVGGKANKAEVQLTLPAVIGRGRDADLTVAHATVSRRHCMLYERDGALMVRDNGSLNGTVIEGERIQEAVLRPGATLTVGPLTFRAEYDHQGNFPSLVEPPTLPNVQSAVGNVQQANGSLHTEEPAEAAADSELALDLPDTEPPVDEEAPSFGFLSDPAEAPAAQQDSDSEAPPVDEEPEGPSGADSQLPEITLHDPEDAPAADEDSGEYAVLTDSAAPSLDFPVAEVPVAGDDQAHSLTAPSSSDAEDAPENTPAAAENSSQVRMEDSDGARIKLSAAGSANTDSDAAAFNFSSDAPAAGNAEKSSKRPAKPSESMPDIKLRAEKSQAAAAEDDELNSFFDSIGLE